MSSMMKNPALLKHALLLLFIVSAACADAMADDEGDAKERIAQFEKKYSLTDEKIRRTCVALGDGYGSTLERAVMIVFCLGGKSIEKSMFGGAQGISADRMEMLQSDCRNKLQKGSFAYNEGVVGLQYELHIPSFDKKNNAGIRTIHARSRNDRLHQCQNCTRRYMADSANAKSQRV